MSKPKKVLVTGTAGFIGFHLAERLLKEGYEVVGLDIINDYYDVNLKYARLDEHGINGRDLAEREMVSSSKYPAYRFLKADLADHDFIVEFMNGERFDYVVNLAAQAGVRYSIDNPRAYTHSNIDGFLSILEGCRHSEVQHLVYASTSSVYGLNTQMPLSEKQPTEHPMALYAATKKANEMMAHSYSHLFRLPTTGLRFFTVYGPWGRPDMAPMLFLKAILEERPIKVFNRGDMARDFSYVEGITETILRLVQKPAASKMQWNGRVPEIPSSSAPYRIFNVGNSKPVDLLLFIQLLEKELGKTAAKEYVDMQPGDVQTTHADCSAIARYIRYKPYTEIECGIASLVSWYRSFYNAEGGYDITRSR